jgi:hypothetical protein
VHNDAYFVYPQIIKSMRSFLAFLFVVLCNLSIAQCVGNQSFTLNPAPPIGGYSPGTVVNVCYTMQNWNGTNVQSNWLEGFDINLGSGWTGLTPGAPPINCQGGGGNWLWLNSTTSASTGITVGPGWFFNSQQGCAPCNNTLAGDDWGDSGSCTWTFCFSVTVAQGCTPQNLLIQVTTGADGTWGSWGNNACPTVPLNIYNGSSNAQNLPPLCPIFHN